MLRFLVKIGLMFLLNKSGDALVRPTRCSETLSMAVNATQLSGVWWEVARNPAIANIACVKVNFTEIQPENILQIATTYADSATYLWDNRTMYANVSLVNSNIYGNAYNISYFDGITSTKYTVYKLLNTDYKNYAIFCGYTNATDTETSLGILLTRKRYPNLTQLIELEGAASTLYSDFGNMSLVNQSSTCYSAGAVTQYSTLASIFVFLLTIIFFVI